MDFAAKSRIVRMVALIVALIVAVLPVRLAVGQGGGSNGLIAFKATKDLTESLYVMDPQGSAAPKLVYSIPEDQGWIYQFQWAADYRYLNFLVEQSDTKSLMLAADVTGSSVYSYQNIWPSPLRWSPDGKHIAFYRGLNLGNDDPNRGFFIADPDGSHARLITSLVLSDYEWSPDGNSIAFVTFGDIYTVNTQGDPKLNRVIVNPAPPTQIRWSPDGKNIAFKMYGDLGTVEVSSQKRSDTILGYRDKPYEAQPLSWSLYSWSPDGAWLALYRPVASAPKVSPTALYVMNSDGSKQLQLSEDCAGTRAYWSPDGKSLVCSPTLGSITLVNVGDGKSHTLVDDKDANGAKLMRWSPDGKSLAFISKNAICTISADGSNRVCADSITNLGTIQQLEWQQDDRPVAVY